MYFKVCYHFENIFVFGSGKHFDDPPFFNFLPPCECLSSRILHSSSSFSSLTPMGEGNICCHYCCCPCRTLELACAPSELCSYVTVSGHRVKVEDSQKMQFSDRLSEIERYQRSMRIGTANNNPRPIHQAHLSTQGELIHSTNCVTSPNHLLSCEV